MTHQHSKPRLEGLDLGEAIALDSYKAALTGALAAADSIGDKIVAAAISVATAYGAVIALVTPKDSATPWEVVWPFLPLAVAFGLALWAQSRNISIAAEDEVERVRSEINSTIKAKRDLARLALLALVASLIVAGVIVAKYYGPSAAKGETARSVTVYLNATGSKAIGAACGATTPASIAGTTRDVSADPLELKVNRKECASGGGTLDVARRAITATKAAP